MHKQIISGLTLAGLLAAIGGPLVAPASALPIVNPQTTQSVNYWSHHHWQSDHAVRFNKWKYDHDKAYRDRWNREHHHHHSGITIHL